MAIDNVVEIEELNDRAEKVEKPENAADIIRRFFVQKKRASSLLRITKENFLNVFRKRRSFKKC